MLQRFYLLLALVSTLAPLSALRAQTTLAAGEIAIIRLNGDSPDGFAFVLLREVAAGTEIRFTEQGWREPMGSFQNNSEAHITWTAPAGGLPAGQVIIVTESSTNTFTTTGGGSTTLTSGSFSLSTSGDQVLAYQGTPSNPTFLFAVQSNSTNWQGGNPSSSSQSSLPSGLTDGVNAVAAGNGGGSESEYDNVAFDLNAGTSGSPAELLARIADVANWTGRNSGPYTGAIANFSLTTFPVEWLDLSAHLQGGEVLVYWATATELNNDYFAVERSADGLAFTPVGTLPGAGTSQDVQPYTFVDADPLPGTSYYRIRQVDFDGAFSHSPTVHVTREDQPSIELYPNPVIDHIQIVSPGGSLRIFTLQGQEVLRQALAPGHQVVDLRQLPTGSYLLEIQPQGQDRIVRRIQK